MTRKTLIVRHRFQQLTNHTFAELPRITRPRLWYGESLLDDLAWGPQHPDLATQAALRRCYFRRDPGDQERVRKYAELAAVGHRLVFWGARELSGCLSTLWAIESLQAVGADLRKAVLVPVEFRRYQVREPDALVAMVKSGIPVLEVAEPLVEVRRLVASDSTEIRLDLDNLPDSVRTWCRVMQCVADFLPDERGLDLLDSLLLDVLTTKWQKAGRVLGQLLLCLPEGHWPDLYQLWERLLEMSDSDHREQWSNQRPLCEVRSEGRWNFVDSQVRLTRRGVLVRCGRDRVDLSGRPDRWVGGRLLQARPELRRAGSYREEPGAAEPPVT